MTGQLDEEKFDRQLIEKLDGENLNGDICDI